MSSTLLIELGFEELPASYIDVATEYLDEKLAEFFVQRNLAESVDVTLYGTPRRLAMYVRGLSARQPDREFEVTGPKAEIAYDDAGELTRAALGFLKGRGAVPEQAYQKETNKGTVLAAMVREVGLALDVVIQKDLPTLLGKIPWPKTMRWDESGFHAARPLRWIYANLDGRLLSLRLGSIESDLKTYGHRFHSPEAFTLSDVDSYQSVLKSRKVLVSQAERIQSIRDQAQSKLPAGHVLQDSDALLKEVANLVEWPHLVVGEFSRNYLTLPERLLLCEMNQHQRYFGVYDADGHLSPYFAAVSGSEVQDDVALADGFGRVAIARFEDARFYYEKDLKDGLEALKERSDKMVFHRQIGTLKDKLDRIEMMLSEHPRHPFETAGLHPYFSGLDIDPKDVSTAIRYLKSDLSSGVVGEFPELQGYMGKIYGLELATNVSSAIESHYQPIGRHDRLPIDDLGKLLSFADKLDTLVQFARIDKLPKGSDPFGLRRMATSIVRLASELGDKLSMNSIISIAFHDSGLGQSESSIYTKRLREFIWDRIPGALNDGDIPTEIIQAATTDEIDNLAVLNTNIQALNTVYQQDPALFSDAAALFKRMGNILSQSNVDVETLRSRTMASLIEDAELALKPDVEEMKSFHRAAQDRQDSIARLKAAVSLRPKIEKFFDHVMVMDENEEIRLDRLALLWSIKGALDPVADFSKLQDLAKRAETR